MNHVKGSAKAVLWARIAFVVLLIAATGAFFWQSPQPNVIQVAHADKYFHIGVFFLLSITLHLGFALSRPLVFLLLGLYGLCVELIQGYIPGRVSSDWYDWLANCVGVLLYFALVFLYQKLIKKR